MSVLTLILLVFLGFHTYLSCSGQTTKAIIRGVRPVCLYVYIVSVRSDALRNDLLRFFCFALGHCRLGRRNRLNALRGTRRKTLNEASVVMMGPLERGSLGNGNQVTMREHPQLLDKFPRIQTMRRRSNFTSHSTIGRTVESIVKMSRVTKLT